jgi:hypothetical protein
MSTPKIAATMQELVLAYLTQSYEQLETDGFLAEQDVTFPQAADLLNDFVIFVHAFCDNGKGILSTEVNESTEERIGDLLAEHLEDMCDNAE